MQSIIRTTAVRINRTLRAHPLESQFYVVSADMGAVFFAHGIISHLPWTVPVSFAAAFGIGRLSRRLQIPWNLAVCGVVSRRLPELTSIRLSEIFSTVKGLVKMPLFRRTPAPIVSGARLIDSYGVLYLLVSRASAATVTLGVFAAMDYVNVESLVGVSDSPSVLGSWAAAVTASSALYPLTFLGIIPVVPQLARARISWLKRRRSK